MKEDETSVFHCSITDIQTVTFPLPHDYLTLDKNRRFFVSVTDGIITKETRSALLDRQKSLQWSEVLDGFIVHPSSQVTLKVFQEHQVRQNKLVATFFLSYDTLRSSTTELVQCIDTKKSVSREIRVTWSERLPPTRTSPENHVSTLSRDDIDITRSRFQNASEDAAKLKNAPGLAVKVVNVSESVGKTFDTASKIIPTVQGFFEKCEAVTNQLAFIVRAVDAIAEVHPYAKIVWSVISFIPKKMSEQIQLDKDVMDLLSDIELALDLAPDEDTLKLRCRKSDLHEKTLIRLLQQINECGSFIQSYVKDVNFGNRLLKNLANDGKTVVQDFRQVMKKLRDDFVSDAIIAVETEVFRISESITAIQQDIKEVEFTVKLHKLPYGQGTDFDPERGCLPRTRVRMLDELVDWVNDPSSPRALLLLGQAGTGKSAIAHEIARRFRCMDQLRTSYRFVRGEPAGRECYRFFTTLAHNLCNKYPTYKVALNQAIKNNVGLGEMKAYTTLFESLIRDPLKDVCLVGRVLVVIDALDESEDASDTRPRDTLPFHEFLASRLDELPSNFRILITARPEEDLERTFSESPSLRKVYMDNAELSVGLDDDMNTYMRTKLSKARGVAEDDYNKLARKAEGNFQWAFIACDYITRPPKGLNTRSCIDRLLNPFADIRKPLDEIYTTILNRFDMEDREVSKNFKTVMGRILGAFEPLSIDALNAMYALEDVSDVVRGLGSLLSHVTPSESALPIAPLHTSFRDFLTTEARSGLFYVNVQDVHDGFTLATLRTMEQRLAFNMCKLETSYLLNSQVTDLKKRVEDNIPLSLSYSCRFWADHLTHFSKWNSNVLGSLEVFMKEQFLFWLEVLSVIGDVAVALPALLSLQDWLNKIHDDKVESGKMYTLVEDAVGFVRYFGYLIAASAPHIYLSALPFSPSSSIIFDLYTPRFRTLQLERGRLMKWPASQLTLPTRVECVAWSRDGKYIAGGSEWGAQVYMWHTSTGTLLSVWDNSKPTRPHTLRSAVSATFSSDGQRLSVGFVDGIIDVWDVLRGTRTVVQGPWIKDEWHDNGVSAMAFAEDGNRLALGTSDHEVWVWDLEKEKLIGEPFAGHNNPVWALSFLDDEHLLSRSGFRTVQVWNIKTRATVTRTDIPVGTIRSTASEYYVNKSYVESNFEACSWTEAEKGEEMYKTGGGRQSVWRPAAEFSADGKLVATCSPTHVSVWYAMGENAGKLAGGPFSHEKGKCVAFSADGQRIASGGEGPLRVWNVKQVDEDESEMSSRREPRSAALIPGGDQIVVRWRHEGVSVLNALTGQEVVKLNEHGTPEGLVVSPNGDKFVVRTLVDIHIWTRSGEEIPLKAKLGLVWFVSFSPDSKLVAYATAFGDVSVLDAESGALIAGPKEFGNGGLSSINISLSMANDSTTMKTLVAVRRSDHFRIWEILTGCVAGPFTPHDSDTYFCALVFSPDGKYIISLASDHTLCIWDPSDGKVVKGPCKLLDRQADISDSCIAAFPQGCQVVLIEARKTILLFDVDLRENADDTLNCQRTLVISGHAGVLLSCSISQDGQYMATTSTDRTIKIWDLQAIKLDQKRALENSAPDDIDFFSLDETWIDDDGWAICTNGGHGPRPLFWVPDIHRNGLYRSNRVRVVVGGGGKETRLGFESFCHGKNWVKCWVGS